MNAFQIVVLVMVNLSLIETYDFLKLENFTSFCYNGFSGVFKQEHEENIYWLRTKRY